MSLQRAYQNGDAEGYKQYLEEHAEEFGLTTEQVQGMGHPVLIREVDGAPADTEGLRVLGSDLNKDFKKASVRRLSKLSVRERASVKRARHRSPNGLMTSRTRRSASSWRPIRPSSGTYCWTTAY